MNYWYRFLKALHWCNFMNESQFTCSMSYLCQIDYLGHFEGFESHFSKLFFDERAASLGILAQSSNISALHKDGRFPNTGRGKWPLSPQPRHWQMLDMHLIFQGGCVPILLYRGCTLNCAMLCLTLPAELGSGAAGSASHTDVFRAAWAPRHLPGDALQKGPMLGADKSQLLSLDRRFLSLMNRKKSLQMRARCSPKAQKATSH